MARYLLLPLCLCLCLCLLFCPIRAQSTAEALSCFNPITRCTEDLFSDEEKFTFEHAKHIQGLSFKEFYVEFTVSSNEESEYKYALVKCGCKPPETTKDRTIIFTNPKHMYIGEGPALEIYAKLYPNLESLAFVTNKNFIYSPPVRRRVNGKSAKEIQTLDETDYSKLEADNVSLSIIGDNSFTIGPYRDSKTPVPFLVFAESDELTPLGRAEWMKIMGLLVDRSASVNNIFSKIVANYEDAKVKAQGAAIRPSVFFGFPSVDSSASPARLGWSQTPSDSYIAQYMRDAKADYRYSDADRKEDTSGLNMSTIRDDFSSSRFLIQSSIYLAPEDATLQYYVAKLREEDEKTKEDVEKTIVEFDAVKCANVWSHQRLRSSDLQADAFFERGINEPDVVLNDFIKILHPYLDTGHEIEFMHRYEEKKDGPLADRCPYEGYKKTAGKDKKMVEKYFRFEELDRFQVEDRLEKTILPAVRSGRGDDNDKDSLGVFFLQRDEDSDATIMTVRREIDDKNETIAKFERSFSMLRALRKAMEEEVTEVDEDRKEKKDDGSGDDDDGGIGAGGIIGILIAVIVLLVICYFAYRHFRKPALAVPGGGHAGQEGEFWNDPDVGMEGTTSARDNEAVF